MPNITQSTTIIFIILMSLALWAVMRIIKKYIPLLPRKEKTRELLRKQTTAFEIIIWLIYLSIIGPHLSDSNNIFNIIFLTTIICLIIIVSFLFLRDYFAGVIFRNNYNIEENDLIKYNDIIGRIKKIGLINVEIETTNNEIIYIPFYKIRNGIISKISDNEQNHNRSFSFIINSGNLSKDISSNITKMLLSFPTVSTQKLPNVNINHDINSQVIINVTFTSLDDNFDDEIIETIKNKFR